MAATSKKTLYVGGLAENVDASILKSAFSPFGDIIDVSIPLDYTTQKHKGFAFIEFQLPEDALDAIDNMDNGEILGKTIRVNIAKPMRFKESATRPIWADDEYLRKVEAESNNAAEPNPIAESETNPTNDNDSSDSNDSD